MNICSIRYQMYYEVLQFKQCIFSAGIGKYTNGTIRKSENILWNCSVYMWNLVHIYKFQME